VVIVFLEAGYSLMWCSRAFFSDEEHDIEMRTVHTYMEGVS